MEQLLNINLFRLLTSTTFWINVGLVLVITLVSWWLFTKALGLVHKRVGRWAEAHNNGRAYKIFLDVLGQTRQSLLLIVAFLVSLQFVPLPGKYSALISHTWFLVLALQVALWLDQAVQSWLHHSILDNVSRRNPVTLIILGLLVRALVWAVMLLSILANVGVDITALVASLGVGGIAIALAVQTVLSDVFASLSIGFDKPFEIGDFVVFNDVSGTIEHIGLKTTRIRSLSGEQIVCANAILLQQTIHNYKRMQTRRIVFTVGIALNTPADKLRKIGPEIEKIVGQFSGTRFDRAHFASFADDRLMLEIVHILSTADYNQYMDLQQEINIRIIEALETLGVELAMPSRMIVANPQRDPAGFCGYVIPARDDIRTSATG